ncbi:unnamed protein product [Blepharisma stoltei]|uniref:Uncharacterized protein n=1 Tax=Blepharisma stoltei TaxID=1481888 RepID=A0AAU9K3K1_9CILI|nr:unnamed protein product [Blepharisma stoltei]
MGTQLADIRNTIISAIKQTQYLKAIVESVPRAIGEEGEAERLEEIKRNARYAEEQIEACIMKLQKCPKSILDSKRKAELSNESKRNYKVKKNSHILEGVFKVSLLKFGILDLSPVPGPEMRPQLEDLKENYKKRKVIESFEYSDAGKSVYRINTKLLFGIKLLMICSEGTVKRYEFSLESSSLNLNQFLSLVESRWETSLACETRSFMACFNKLLMWMELHKNIFTEKCYVCNLHLSFRTGFPMIPLIVHNTFGEKRYFHIHCYFDTNI